LKNERNIIMKKCYNQPATLVALIDPMTILCVSDPALGGGGSGAPIGGADPGSGI
jgi:hypothetical protein